MSDYVLRIEFPPDSHKPARIFQAMSGLIESFNEFDEDLLGSIDVALSSEMVLHDVERGSLKAILRSILTIPDREALRDGDWKKVIGRFIDDGRNYLLSKLENEPQVVDKRQLTTIQEGLIEIAASVPAGLIHVPKPILLPQLLTTIESFESATRVLTDRDSATYISEYRQKRVSTEIFVSSSLQEEILDSIPVQQPTRFQLTVKKPDLIGDSQWDLYLGRRVIRARILDVDWLKKFHDRVIELKPGDALDALLDITMLQSIDGRIVGYRYQVLRVFNVARQVDVSQLEFPDEP